jgi:antitoxin YefM
MVMGGFKAKTNILVYQINPSQLGIEKQLDKAYAMAYALSVHFRSNLMSSFTVSEARSNLYRLIDEAADSHQPVLITGKRNNAILISEEDWTAIQETLYLLSVPGMRESIRESMAEPIDKCAKELDW